MKLKYLVLNLVIIGAMSSCGISEEQLEGRTYYLGNYHYVDFSSNGSYYIYQKTDKDSWVKTCGGNGNFTIVDGQVVLGPNDSNCESTKGMAKKYPNSTFAKSAYE